MGQVFQIKDVEQYHLLLYLRQVQNNLILVDVLIHQQQPLKYLQG